MDSLAQPVTGNKGQRRSRAAQACTTCRKHKVRCEILDSGEVLRCHRCRTLNMQCSYEEIDRATFLATHKSGKASQVWEQVIDFGELGQEDPSRSAGPQTPRQHGPVSASSTNSLRSAAVKPPVALELDALPRYIWELHRVAPATWRPPNTLPIDEGPVDWSSPIDATQELTSRYHSRIVQLPPAPSPVSTAQNTLESILSEAQIKDLLGIFLQTYVPWLNFSPIRGVQNSLLDLVCCAVAARHLSSELRESLVPKLINAAEDNISRTLLHPHPTDALMSIQSLLIFATWAPIDVYERADNRRDPHILLSAAVSMALSIHLNESVDRLATLKSLQAKNVSVDEAQLAEATDKARLWLCIANTDSMLCIGTNRTAISRRGPTYLSIFPRPTSATSDLTEGRDVRLRLMGETFQATEIGLATSLNSLSELDAWHLTLDRVLNQLDDAFKYLSPLAVVSDFEQVQFRVYNIMSRCCRLIVLYHTIYTARMLSVYAGTSDPLWFKTINPRSIDVLVPWGKEALCICEEVLVCLLETDIPKATSAPDQFFHFIEFSGAFLICFKFMVFSDRNYEIPGTSDIVLERVISKLRSAVDLEDHPARKCANLLNGLLSLWLNKDNALGAMRSKLRRHTSPSCPQTSTEPTTAESEAATSTSPEIPPPPLFPAPLDNLAADWMNNAVFQDVEFWSFLANPQDSER